MYHGNIVDFVSDLILICSVPIRLVLGVFTIAHIGVQTKIRYFISILINNYINLN